MATRDGTRRSECHGIVMTFPMVCAMGLLCHRHGSVMAGVAGDSSVTVKVMAVPWRMALPRWGIWQCHGNSHGKVTECASQSSLGFVLQADMCYCRQLSSVVFAGGRDIGCLLVSCALHPRTDTVHTAIDDYTGDGLLQQ